MLTVSLLSNNWLAKLKTDWLKTKYLFKKKDCFCCCFIFVFLLLLWVFGLCCVTFIYLISATRISLTHSFTHLFIHSLTNSICTLLWFCIHTFRSFVRYVLSFVLHEHYSFSVSENFHLNIIRHQLKTSTYINEWTAQCNSVFHRQHQQR